MKNRYIIVSISIILLVSIITLLINKNSKEYIMQDGVMLALTLDGEKITSYPEGTNYGVEINCENGKGKWLADEWKLAVEEITGNVVCNIDFTSNPKTLKGEVEEVNASQNYDGNGYRYSGTNPNNYIWFNNELWRIIGSIPTCLSASCGTNTTNLVKIIRNESIGTLAYDAKYNSTSGVGTWGYNTLYTLLNNYYYGIQNGTATNYCYGYSTSSKVQCDYTVKGINPSGYYGKMVKNVYWNTGRSINTTVSSIAYGNEKNTQTISGYVGLMSASDYGYATDNTYHNENLSYYNTLSITSTNWLYGKGYEITSVWYSSSNYDVLAIDLGGGVVKSSAVGGYVVRPVVYLDPLVYIISGDGTEGNPYQIGM